MELVGFIIFLFLYLALFNLLFSLKGYESPVFAPGTLLFSFLGYWLAGYLYDRYLK
ncbi:MULTISPECIES: hypothetical protein [unclassified Methanosarcina]|uniref:hypothetical protein n=1 Tax=unclassified Methanosarcina TaxID=2644672 RepID=UPI000A4AC21B|nr:MULTISPECIES: hypothetical protein [unclassified Methanosarcina]